MEGIIGVVFTAVIGLAFCCAGLTIWKKHNLRLLNKYHYGRVTGDNLGTFCTLYGIGVLLIGAGLLLTSALMVITASELSLLAFAAGMISGFSIIIRAITKYNS